MKAVKKKLTVAQAAEEAGVEDSQIVRWVDSDKFRSWNMSEGDRPGRRAIRIDPESFQDFMNSRIIQPKVIPRKVLPRDLPVVREMF